MIRDLVEAIHHEDADAVRRLLGEDGGLVAATDPDSFGDLSLWKGQIAPDLSLWEGQILR
ncbi:MAG TPA: hypothetical protein VGG06_25665 [Thermoanaerobaculia bacterium]|jgi:hypothetical protein